MLDGVTLDVKLSDPERRKQRTDANANLKEVHVGGLSKQTKKEDLEQLFGQVRYVISTNCDQARD